MPYIALQVYGIEVCIGPVGVPVHLRSGSRFGLLALFTYVSGLRSATLIAIVKDVLIWITVIVAVIYIPLHLGGYHHAFFASARREAQALPHSLEADYVTLALGSALRPLPLSAHADGRALVEEPLGRAAQLASSCRSTPSCSGCSPCSAISRSPPAIKPDAHYGANFAVPGALQPGLPAWFAGFALASIAIGALVPAAMMAIAAANLFTRNI